ncbi:MAG: NCS2 family permease [Balneolaceae bacterium]
MIRKLTGLDKRNIGKEISAGVTTFLTMSYILFVNPQILSDAGMDFDAVITATALAACFGTLLMAFWVKAPMAMAPGMGLNAFFAYTLVIGEGITWETALGVVFISGAAFLILTIWGVREKIVNSIPLSLRLAIPAGIGLFIALIGFQNMGLIVSSESTMISLGSFSPEVILGLCGLLLIIILESKKVKGSILVGILAVTTVALLIGQISWDGQIMSAPPSPAPVAFQLDIMSAFSWGLMGAIFSFMFVDLFDSVGTMVACSYEAGMVRKDGTIEKIDKMLESDAVATVFGSLIGTSTTTTYIESAAGIEAGGRSGFTSLVTALLFIVALFFTPLIALVPVYATAPALVVVGIFMFKNIRKIPLEKFTDIVPVFLTVVLMPLTYSISLGLTFGILSWVILKAVSGDFSNISGVMWIVGVLSAINLAVGGG